MLWLRLLQLVHCFIDILTHSVRGFGIFGTQTPSYIANLCQPQPPPLIVVIHMRAYGPHVIFQLSQPQNSLPNAQHFNIEHTIFDSRKQGDKFLKILFPFIVSTNMIFQ